jgi:hypothetical protein
MKYFSFRIFIGMLTFFLGISFVMFRYVRPASQPSTDEKNVTQAEVMSDEDKAAWQTLLSFENKDLRRLNQENWEQEVKLNKAIDVLIGRQIEEPRLISKISNSQGQINYVFILELPMLVIPGNSSLRVFVFNIDGKLLNNLAFPAGYRIELKDIRVIFNPEIGREIIEVESEPVINGRNIAKQYYALVGENVLPVRLEDSKAKSLQNNYVSPDHTIGYTMVNRSMEEWEKALESDDTAEILATLAWINGKHFNAMQYSPRYYEEAIKEARLAYEIKSNSRTKATLEKLKQSGNKWIREAANLPIEGN